VLSHVRFCLAIDPNESDLKGKESLETQHKS
jgi:hypothetical protein